MRSVASVAVGHGTCYVLESYLQDPGLDPNRDH
jgi:hypothetical protein